MNIKLIYLILIIISLAGCRTLIQSTKKHSQPNIQTVIPRLNFNFESNKTDTEKRVLLKLSNSPFQLDMSEDNPYDISFSFSGLPELYVDCGKTTIVNSKKDEVINRTTFNNTNSNYSYKQYRRNHLDTYQIHNDLKMNANIVISGDEYNSKVSVQTNYKLSVKKETLTTQGYVYRKFKKYKLRFTGTENKFFEAFGSDCQTTGKFEQMIADLIS